MAMPTTIDGRAAIQSSLVRAWGLEGYARIQRTVRETDVSSDADFQRFYNRFYRVRRNAEWQSSYYAIMEREKATHYSLSRPSGRLLLFCRGREIRLEPAPRGRWPTAPDGPVALPLAKARGVLPPGTGRRGRRLIETCRGVPTAP